MGDNEKLHPQGDGVLGHGEWGIGHGKNSPMPNADGRLSLYTHKGMEFTADFPSKMTDD